MKKTITNIISMLMALSFVFAVSMPLYAYTEEYGANSLGLEMNDIVNQPSVTVVNDKGLTVVVDFEPAAVGKVTLSEVMDIANEVEELGHKITIHGIGYPEDNTDLILQNNFGSNISPTASEEPEPEPTFTDLFIYSNVGVTKLAEEHFITSVAKGQTITFTAGYNKSYSLKLNSSIDASLGVDLAELKASLGTETTSEITLSISASFEFTGPPEDSEHNTRVYGVRFYHRNRYYRINVNGERVIGQFWEPMHYIQYSEDYTVY